jgi:AAA domain
MAPEARTARSASDRIPSGARPAQRKGWRSRRGPVVVATVWLGLTLGAQIPAHAQAPSASASAAPPAASGSGSVPASSASAASDVPPPPTEAAPDDVAALVTHAQRIQALLRGELELELEPAALFDVDPADERALAVEIERLRRVLAEAAAKPEADAGVPGEDTGADPRKSDAGKAPADAGPSDAGTDAEAEATGEGGGEPVTSADPTLLEARLELDRARLAFYELAPDERTALFAGHKKRQAESSTTQAKKELSDAEREQREAAEEKRRAEEDAKNEQHEAKRLVAEERVRLLGVKESQAALAATLAQQRIDLNGMDERVLAWQRPSDTILKALEAKRPEASAIDAVYDEVATRLVKLRDDLSTSVAVVNDPPKNLVPVGEDPVASLSVDVDKRAVETLRAELLEAESSLLADAEAQRWVEMRHVMKAMEALDHRRLGLIPLLSASKRAELEGFGPVGLEQARKEALQLTLVLRYHLKESRRFITSVRETGETGGSAFVATITALKWMLPIGLFIWWRRRAEDTLEQILKSARQAAQRNRRARADGPSLAERLVQFYKRIRGPLEWLLLIWAVISLLPEGATKMLEVQLLWTALRWTFGGRLVVRAIDALFAEDKKTARQSRMQTAHLRFQTLRLLGRVVVTFGLILALTSDLVGHGTIYAWASFANWIIAIPVALVIVRWWRDVIFHLVELQRKKGPILKWIAETKAGWQSFPAAVAGGSWLLGHNIAKFLRGRVLGIDVVKRVLAYWFRREVTKQSEARKSHVEDSLLDDVSYKALDPQREAGELVASVADEQVDDVIQRVRRQGGAVYAVVGERGAGKSTLLRRIREKTPDTVLVTCPVDGIHGFHRALRSALDMPEDATADEVSAKLNKGTGNNALLIDEAQHLVHPVVDGLEELDRIIGLARQSSVGCTWVFAFDSVIWAYFSRAREVRPLFDDIIKLQPWSEEGIVRLLKQRSEVAGIDPDFSRLIGDLPEDADHQDEVDALERARSGYFRLLWDYSLGNPAVSLHFWRASLRVSAAGDFIVRLFDPPNTADLERLPDSAVFVLRAIVQLDEASIDDVAEATMLDRQQVEDAVRYALVRRYLEQVGDRVRVRWTWFRTITRFLARRHLLVGPDQS